QLHRNHGKEAGPANRLAGGDCLPNGLYRRRPGPRAGTTVTENQLRTIPDPTTRREYLLTPMEFLLTRIPDVILIKPKIHGDPRGFFLESWQKTRFTEAGIEADFVQDNLSRSTANTL